MLPHIFCCGLPVAAAVVALGSTTGLAAALAGNPFYDLVNDWHRELLIAAVASVGLSGLLTYVAYKMDCRAAAVSCCSHDDCKPQKRHGLRLFLLSLVLLVADVSWFATEEMVLGLHHHEHGEHDHAEVEPAAHE